MSFLQKGSSIFADPRKFACYLVMNPNNPMSLNSALRYWGCAIQAGAQVSGAFGIPSETPSMALADSVKSSFEPLPCTFIPHLKFDSHLHWNEIVESDQSKFARNLLSEAPKEMLSSVTYDLGKKSVNLFMPGFDKSEIKLYQVSLSNV